MNPQSAKAKGRRLQQLVRDTILGAFPHLHTDDVTSRSMGAGGEDILLSPVAREAFPFSIEAKNQQALNIWSAMAQAEANKGSNIPLLVFKRNGTDVYAVLPFYQLVGFMKALYQYEIGTGVRADAEETL